MIISGDKYRFLDKIGKVDIEDIIKEGNSKLGIPYSGDYTTLHVINTVTHAFNKLSGKLLNNIFFIKETFFDAVMKSPFLDAKGNSTPQSTEMLFELFKRPCYGIMIHQDTVFFYNIVSEKERYYLFLNGYGIHILSAYYSERMNKLEVYPTAYLRVLAARNRVSEQMAVQTFLKGFSTYLIFKTFAKVETIQVNRNTRLKYNKEKYLNKLGIDVQVLDCTWFTTIVRTEGFKVRGHFRLQPKKDENGEWTKELIYISEFKKHGYTRTAKMIS